ncbi:MAG: MATE family efflux transporter [Clostridiales bacterium]|nr:MATE family efflux transporter [Clostridiales bacterium]
MARAEINMTEGNLWRQIFRYSVPLMFSNVLQVLFHMSDIAVVGRFSGPTALGAVGSTAILVTLFTGFIMGVSSGVNATAARYMGAQRHQDTRETVHTSAIICLLLGILVMVLGLIFSRPILELLGTKDELIDGATLYLRIYLLGMPALGIFNFGNAVLSAAGDTKRPLYFLSTAGVINVILNLFFVIVCHMSVAGVALASIISQYISAVLILLSLGKAPENYALRKNELRISRDKAGQVLSLGLPTGFQYSIFAIANLFIQSGVNTFDALMVEGNSAAANADGLIYDVMAAFYTACTSFISQNLGAKKKGRILKCYGISTVYSFGIAAILGGLLLIFGREFLSIFTTDASVIDAGMHRLTVMGFSYAVSAFMDNAIAASRGLGKSVIPTVIVIMGSCVFRIIWVYTIFAHFGTILSLYLLYIFSWSLTAIAENIYFFHIYRKQTKALEA